MFFKPLTMFSLLIKHFLFYSQCFHMQDYVSKAIKNVFNSITMFSVLHKMFFNNDKTFYAHSNVLDMVKTIFY